MNPIFKKVVRKKLTEVTSSELMIQAQSYHIELSPTQATQIVKMFRSKKSRSI